MYCEHVYQGGVTLVDSIATAMTAVSQRSTIKPPIWVQSTVKAAHKYSQCSGPSMEQTQITVLQFTPNWNRLQQYNAGGVTHVMK